MEELSGINRGEIKPGAQDEGNKLGRIIENGVKNPDPLFSPAAKANMAKVGMFALKLIPRILSGSLKLGALIASVVPHAIGGFIGVGPGFVFGTLTCSSKGFVNGMNLIRVPGLFVGYAIKCVPAAIACGLDKLTGDDNDRSFKENFVKFMQSSITDLSAEHEEDTFYQKNPWWEPIGRSSGWGYED